MPKRVRGHGGTFGYTRDADFGGDIGRVCACAPAERDGALAIVVQIILTLLQVLSWALIGRAILSWFDPQMRWSISRALADVTEPLIAPIRQVIPPIGGMIDISFIVAILLIQVLSRLLRQALLGY